jgi:hypothetical protein
MELGPSSTRDMYIESNLNLQLATSQPVLQRRWFYPYAPVCAIQVLWVMVTHVTRD